MKLAALFALTSVGGGVGKFGGILAGSIEPAGVGLLLQFVLGAAGVVVAVMVAERMGVLRHHQRGWTCAGGILGVAMATLVTLSTLSSPIAPFLVPLMMGMGATLGSLIGKSAHERADLT
jgi:hypothetical protein